MNIGMWKFLKNLSKYSLFLFEKQAFELCKIWQVEKDTRGLFKTMWNSLDENS